MSVDPDVSEVCQAEETPPVDPPKYTYLPCSGPRLAAAGQKTKDKGKGKDNDIKELEGIIEFIDKVSSRRLASQSVILEGSMQDRIKKLQQRDSQKVSI